MTFRSFNLIAQQHFSSPLYSSPSSDRFLKSYSTSASSVTQSQSIKSLKPSSLQRNSASAKKQIKSRSSSHSINPGGSLKAAYNIGKLDRQLTLTTSFKRRDNYDYYRFQLSGTKVLNFGLDGMSGNTDLQLLNRRGSLITGSAQPYANAESIHQTLRKGTYYLRVLNHRSQTNYNLHLKAKSFTQPTRNSSRRESDQADWTVMVYMAGDNLEDFGVADFQEMAAIGSSQRVNILAQFDRTQDYDTTLDNWAGTRRGLIRPGDIPDLDWGTGIGEVNMGNPNVLKSFVNWGMTHYRAKNYALVMWGHGDGLTVSYDDTTGDSISAKELNQALTGLPDRVNLIGADACLMSTTEFAYELKDRASVFVGSQNLEPGTGWNYTPILKDLTRNPSMTASQLGATVVYRYKQTYGSNSPDQEMLSAIDLHALKNTTANNLPLALNQFASTVMNYATRQDRQLLSLYRDRRANVFGEGTAPDYYDIGNLFTDFAGSSRLTSGIRAAARRVLNAYRGLVIRNYSSVPQQGTGLSIYFPTQNSYWVDAYSSASLSFLTDTQWDELLTSEQPTTSVT